MGRDLEDYTIPYTDGRSDAAKARDKEEEDKEDDEKKDNEKK